MVVLCVCQLLKKMNFDCILIVIISLKTMQCRHAVKGEERKEETEFSKLNYFQNTFKGLIF